MITLHVRKIIKGMHFDSEESRRKHKNAIKIVLWFCVFIDITILTFVGIIAYYTYKYLIG